MSSSTGWCDRFIELPAQQLTEPASQRQSEDFLDGTVRAMCEVIFAAPRSASQQDPVGGAITRPAKAVRIDERLGKPDRVPIHPLPVARQSRRHAAENVRGQMRHLYPRQDQVACVVRDKWNV